MSNIRDLNCYLGNCLKERFEVYSDNSYTGNTEDSFYLFALEKLAEKIKNEDNLEEFALNVKGVNGKKSRYVVRLYKGQETFIKVRYKTEEDKDLKEFDY